MRHLTWEGSGYGDLTYPHHSDSPAKLIRRPLMSFMNLTATQVATREKASIRALNEALEAIHEKYLTTYLELLIQQAKNNLLESNSRKQEVISIGRP